MLQNNQSDTIVALSTPPGKGALAVVRTSGIDINTLMEGVLGFSPKPRHAYLTTFKGDNGSLIDSGIAIYFPAPTSYTGEDILELQSHGSPVIVDSLLKRLINLGARIARPGEFTERAFLNNKIDLTQAEGIADLIESKTEAAARCAQKSLQGVFSNRVNKLKNTLIELRIFLEASIDFSDEEIDFLSDGKIIKRLQKLHDDIGSIQKTAKLGCLLRDGMTVAIAGPPNAGKSSLLNYLAGKDSAIVTEWEGTTRDVLRETIQIDGMPLHIVDTAGLRETNDPIEKMGIERAINEIKQADRVLLIIDHRFPNDVQKFIDFFPDARNVTKVFNKIDLTGFDPKKIDTDDGVEIYLSIKENKGMQTLLDHLKQSAGYDQDTEAVFIARRRHLTALKQANFSILNALQLSKQKNYGCELMAEDLRISQNALSEITGEFSSEDLLGEIFSTFCIGK